MGVSCNELLEFFFTASQELNVVSKVQVAHCGHLPVVAEVSKPSTSTEAGYRNGRSAAANPVVSVDTSLRVVVVVVCSPLSPGRHGLNQANRFA